MTFFTSLKPVALSSFRGTVKSTRSWPRKFFAISNPERAPQTIGAGALSPCCGPLTSATTTQIQALPLEQLEALADALLDFQGPADLAAWLAANTATTA